MESTPLIQMLFSFLAVDEEFYVKRQKDLFSYMNNKT